MSVKASGDLTGAGGQETSPSDVRRERDFARELVERVERDAANQQPKPEAETARAIEERAALHESAYLQAKQPALEALAKDADPADRSAARLSELRKRDVEVTSTEVARQWAALDARDLAKLTESGRQEDAAITMAENARNNAVYKASLSPDVATRVETIYLADQQRQSLKEVGKAQDQGLNGIEPAIEKQAQKLDAESDDKRAAWLRKGQATQVDEQKPQAAATSGNKVESDEIFTASNAVVKPVVPAEVEQKYLRVGDKFYHPKATDVVAFEDKGNKLETRSNSEQVAESMVTIARARGWDEIKVSGTETFKKEVWVEAAAHGMQVKGYVPTEQDKAELAKRTRDVDTNKVEPDKTFRARESETAPGASKDASLTRQAGENVRTVTEGQAQSDSQSVERQARAQAFVGKPAKEAVKEHPELAGAFAMEAAMQKQAEDARKADGKPLSAEERAIVAAVVRKNIVNSIERGDLPQVNVREQREVHRERKEEREVSR